MNVVAYAFESSWDAGRFAERVQERGVRLVRRARAFVELEVPESEAAAVERLAGVFNGKEVER